MRRRASSREIARVVTKRPVGRRAAAPLISPATEAITCTQRSHQGGHQRGNQPPSTAISRHQPSSAVISRHQPSSAAISRHQPASAAISRHQPPSSYLFKLLDVCTRHSELTAHLAHLALARLPLRRRVEHETATARRLGHQRRLGRRWLGRSARRSRRRSGCARPSQIRASVLRSRFVSRARRELEVRQPLLQLRVLLKLRGERRT